MAWNEPGNNDKDPWAGNRNRGNGDGPPDLDEVFKKTIGKLFGGGSGSGGGNRKGDGSAAFIFVAVAVVLVLIYAYQGAGVINEQEKAVVLRFGKFHQIKEPGFRWNPPFIDQVFTENVTRVRTWTTNEQMLTKDLNIVDIKLSVQFTIGDVRNFVLNVKQPVESLQQAANSALRHVVGSTVMHEVLTEGRGAVAIEIQQRLQEYLSSYTTGIQVEKVNVEDTNPPKEVQAAFDDVIRAREDEERYKNEAQAYANDKIPRARGRAQRMVEEATAYREEVVARAEGEAERFTLLLDEYRKAPQVTRERLYLDAMESVLGNSSKVMVDVDGGSNMMYLPLDKLIQEGMKSPTRRSASTPATGDLDELASRIVDRLRAESQANSRVRREGR